MTSHNDKSRPSMAFVAVGSNIDPEANIIEALLALQKMERVTGSSTFYRTEPIGRADQPEFVNGMWLVETERRPRQIRDEVLHVVERQLGRVRTEDKCASRVIDLDLILYDDLVIDDGGICLPHPDIARPFVFGPILELMEDLDACDRESIAELLPWEISIESPGRLLLGLTGKLRSLLR